jgi:hypothetical protein
MTPIGKTLISILAPLLLLLASLQTTPAYYDPGAQRWINRDPLDERGSSVAHGRRAGTKAYGGFAEVTQGSSLYRLVRNNAVNWRDSFGLYVRPTGNAPPYPPGTRISSIECRGGHLHIDNRNGGADSDCTAEHERRHASDWIGRYGPNLCQGVPDGQLPVGGDGYEQFLHASECEAFKEGLNCRLEKARCGNLTPSQMRDYDDGIDRDIRYLNEQGCPD